MDVTKESFSVPRPNQTGARALDPRTPDEVRRAAEDVASSVEEFYRVANAFLGEQAEEHPYVVLGAAAGIGFILGGGLASRLGGILASYGGRMLVARVMSGRLASDRVSPSR